jgi:hypothetical protein
MNGEYCLTDDNILKMVAVFMRLRVGIPVVLMGECGSVSYLFHFSFVYYYFQGVAKLLY